MPRLLIFLAVLVFAGAIIAVEPGRSARPPASHEPVRSTAEGNPPGETTPPARNSTDVDAPETVLLDMLNGQDEGEDFFGPVPFDHAAHTGMAGGCENCHHHTPSGQEHPSCRSCHDRHVRRADIRKPSLKGAYHRQCMGCHREWAHDRSCDACHLTNGEGHKSADVSELRTYMGQAHPVVVEPEISIYELQDASGKASRVIFSHGQHTEQFGLGCVDCHKADNCSRCHGNNGQDKTVSTIDRHRDCAACHQVDAENQCSHCHVSPSQSQPRSFDHAETGWPLAPYHSDVACQDCHKSVPFASLDNACNACHTAAATKGDQCRRDQRCMDCHNPHESLYGYIQREADADICVECHDRFAVSGKKDTGHPVRGAMDQPLPQALIDAGARAGQDPNALNCLSCHSTTTAAFEPLELGTGVSDDLCVACHPEQESIRGTVHDIHNKTSSYDAGTCQTCHPVHEDGPTGGSTQGDPAGRCTSCHQPGGWAQSKSAPASAHPETNCDQCHDPHASRFGSFLVKARDRLCVECHSEQAAVQDGPHAQASPDAESEGSCLSCHVPHGDQGASLLRIGNAQEGAGGDSVCLSCHEDEAWDASSGRAMIHPRDITTNWHHPDPALLETGDDGQRHLTCQSCHDPHGGDKPAHLVRSESGEASGLCLRCHGEKRYIKQTGHSTESLGALGFQTDACKPCHAMHARREDSWGQMLSPRFLAKGAGDDKEVSDRCLPCVTCHQPDGPAPMPEIVTHPRIVLPNRFDPYVPGFLPLFDDKGHMSPDGQITCRTCHLAHGRLDLLQIAAENGKLDDAERRAMRLNVRRFRSPNLCTQCHGEEGRIRFLRFHELQKRPSQSAVAPAK